MRILELQHNCGHFQRQKNLHENILDTDTPLIHYNFACGKDVKFGCKAR